MIALIKRIIKSKMEFEAKPQLKSNCNDFRLKKKHSSLKKAGFTLIELLVVLAIFAIIMGVALFNQASLSSNVLITNLAYETALAVREAQTYGISVKATGLTAGTSLFDKGYGAYFDMANPTQITVFADNDADNTFDSSPVGGVSELQSLYEIKNQRGNKITAICVYDPTYNPAPSPTVPCKPQVGDTSKWSIMFRRPNPESSFYKIANDGTATPYIGPAVIVVNNIDNSNCRAIIVEVTGQIRVENYTGNNCSNTK